ncbi:MAG: metal-dependent hydrolase [Promethearchaeota archaeon]
MPDWITHIISCWFLYQLFVKFEYISHERHFEMLMLVGSVLPDINRLYLIGDSLLFFLPFFTPEQVSLFFLVFHTPIGSILGAGVITQFFDEKKKAFLFSVAGIVTHFILDSLLTSIKGGVLLFFPITFVPIQFKIIHSLDLSYMLLILGIFIAIMVYQWLKRVYTEEEKIPNN